MVRARTQVQDVTVVQAERGRAQVLIQRRLTPPLQHPAVMPEAGRGQLRTEMLQEGRQQIGHRHVRGHGQLDPGGRPTNRQPAHLAGAQCLRSRHADNTAPGSCGVHLPETPGSPEPYEPWEPCLRERGTTKTPPGRTSGREYDAVPAAATAVTARDAQRGAVPAGPPGPAGGTVRQPRHVADVPADGDRFERDDPDLRVSVQARPWPDGRRADGADLDDDGVR